MEMKVPGKSRAPRSSQVEAHVESLRPQHFAKCLDRHPEKSVEVQRFLLIEIFERRDVAVRAHHHMTVIIRIKVEDQETVAGAPEDEMLPVVLSRAA